MIYDNEFILWDTEYTSWKGSQERNWKKTKESNITEYKELVMIGAIKVKKIGNTLKIIDNKKIYIKPTYNPILSDYFKELTGITQLDIDNYGLSFDKGLNELYLFSTNKNNCLLPLYSYGNDYSIVDYNLKLYNFSQFSKFVKWSYMFYDIRDIFDIAIDTSQYTSGTVYKAFNIIPESKIKIHDPLWDSTSLFLSLNYMYENNII